MTNGLRNVILSYVRQEETTEPDEVLRRRWRINTTMEENGSYLPALYGESQSMLTLWFDYLNLQFAGKNVEIERA